jgi:molybdate transport system substrate-binding protein
MKRLILSFIVMQLTFTANSQRINIAAAADLRYAMDDIIVVFKEQYPGIQIIVNYGSSGKFYQQIVNGAPYDLYFSADMLYAQKLHEQGLAISPPELYAHGYIVLWSNKVDVSLGIPSLLNPKISKIAIATPSHAPYGKRAKESLIHYSIFDKIKGKLVYAENVAQTAQFIQSGNAEIGIIALSLALSPAMRSTGTFFLIDEESYTPLKQGFVIIKKSKMNVTAQKFARFMLTTPAKEILKKYGFTFPETN